MKFFAAFVLLVVGISALPEAQVAERNIVTDQIVAAIDDAIQEIKDLGLDPLHIKRETATYALPVPVIFNAVAFCEEILSTGLSNIVIKNINYDIIWFRLTFEIEMPHVHASAQIATGDVVIFDNHLYGSGSGSIDIYNTNVKGEVRVGILGGIGVRTVDIDFTLGTIESQLQINIQGYDLSNLANRILNEIIPETFTAFKPEIDELIGIILLELINENL